MCGACGNHLPEYSVTQSKLPCYMPIRVPSDDIIGTTVVSGQSVSGRITLEMDGIPTQPPYTESVQDTPVGRKWFLLS